MRTVVSTVLSIALAFGVIACVPDDHNVHQDYSQQDSRETYQRSVDVEGMHLTVNSYSIIFTEYQGVKPNARGYFLVVDYSIQNQSSPCGYFDPRVASAVTKEISEYELFVDGSDKFSGVNERIYDLPVKETTAGTLLFELPAGTVPDFLVFKMPNSDKTEAIDLRDPDV